VLNKVSSDDSLHFTKKLYHVLCTEIKHNFKYKFIAKTIQITIVLNNMPYGTLMPRPFCRRVSPLQNVHGIKCCTWGPIKVGY